MARGYISDTGSYILDYESEEELKTVLSDIFFENDNDEYAIFEQFASTCSPEIWDRISDWVHTTW